MPFDQIPWLDIVDADEINIIIPPITVRELNKQKDLSTRQNIRKRAGDVLKKLYRLFETDSQNSFGKNIALFFEDRDPSIDFSEYQLSREIQDDHLIASIIMYKNEYPDAKIVLLTSDSGLSLVAKARRLKIETIQMPIDYRIPYQTDPNQKRINELEQEVRELKSKTPKLTLSFKDGKQNSTFTIQRPIEIESIQIEEQISALKSKYPKRKIEDQKKESKQPNKLITFIDPLSKVRESLPLMNNIPPEEIDRYNQELDKFFEDYAKYLKSSIHFENLIRRTIILPLILSNDGTAPAEDIDVFLKFPNHFQLLRKLISMDEPKQPNPPIEPRTQMQIIMESIKPTITSPILNPFNTLPAVSEPNVSLIKFKRFDDHYSVGFHIKRLKHNLILSFDKLFIAFKSFEEATSFNVDFEILAANVPDKISDKLHVVIKKP